MARYCWVPDSLPRSAGKDDEERHGDIEEDVQDAQGDDGVPKTVPVRTRKNANELMKYRQLSEEHGGEVEYIGYVQTVFQMDVTGFGNVPLMSTKTQGDRAEEQSGEDDVVRQSDDDED